MNNINLNNFFGYCIAKFTTPKNILKPLLRYKHEGKTIFPTGTWTGVHFSEELKAVQKYGYKLTLINGYDISKIYMFNKFVEHFYNKNKNSSSTSTFIAKMHLNQLYGILGRKNKKELIQTINIYRNELPKYLNTRINKSIININDDIVSIFVQNNINSDIIKKMNIYFDSYISSDYS